MNLIKYLICFILLGTINCSREPISVAVTKAQNKTPVESKPMTKSKEEAQVRVIGRFSNVESDGEHEWGFSVSLWKQGDRIHGLISGSGNLRLMGDPPIGLLEDIQFDSKTGKLFFRAKLSTGSFYDKKEGWVPSRDVYEFKGALKDKVLKGELKTTNELCSDKCPEKKKVTLRFSEDMTSTMEEYQSYEEWRSAVDETLKRLGPKW